MPASSRTWGDGATSTAVHVIEGISYVDDRIDCRCGVRVTGIRDGRAWRDHAHRFTVADAAVAVPEPDDAEQRNARLLATFRRLRARCTCATGDVRDCPNYVEGDEEVPE